MAKDKKTSEAAVKKEKKSFLADDRFRIIMGILLLAFSVIITLSVLSYIFTWKYDQSIAWSPEWNEAAFTAKNWIGKMGAGIASLLVDRWFGLASLSIPFIVFLLGCKFLRIKILPFGKSMFVASLSTILVSLWLGLLTLNTPLLGSGLGGRHGHFVALYLKGLAGIIGAVIILLASTLVFLYFFWPRLYNLTVVIAKMLVQLLKGKKPSTNNDLNDPEFETEIKTEAINDLVFETEFKQNENNTLLQDRFEIKNTEDVEEEDEDPMNPYLEEEIHFQDPLAGENEQPETEVLQSGETAESHKAWKKFPLEDYDPTLELSSFKLPPIDLLEKHDAANASVTNEELISNKNKIVETLGHYKISIDKIKATIGPTVTLYEIVPAPGVRISKIKNLEDDIALNLSALGIRIIAPIPGKGTIGIEVPNQQPEVVSMRSLITSRKFQESKFELGIALGKTISNETYVFDLAKMPHLLVAGATGQGKSVGLNVILASLLYRKHPSQLKFVLVDPKKVELTLYQSLEKHYLAKLPEAGEAIITDTQKVIHTLNSLCIEMDERYNLLKKAQVRNIKEYNQKFIKRGLNPENGHKYLPYIVVIIDEFADLIMTAGREVETPLARLAQLARAIGIHLVIATQRPTTNIITGVIKANFPARIAFRVTSMIDSRTILDSPGANQLIGRGDLLFAPGSELIRLQCAFIDIPELERITKYISEQQSYPTAFYLPEYIDENAPDILDVDLSKRDALFDEAARLVVAHQQGSTSLIQRKFSIGYNRAGRIVDQLEAAGVVGPFEGSKARQVLFPDTYSLEQYLKSLN
ncbi:MAG: DNA translocase FtsK 4TM domain-containing protein [Bacteroidota bacterium]|nr:MAG: DNA translocase FtsK 4TM domain-containing protein [Bacteroidota bacterium]